MNPIINALTVDVEDYFQVNAFRGKIPPESWVNYPSRVVENTMRVLDLFDERQVKGTFFVLGWVAKRNPSLVREIQKRGHEVACHGYRHELIYEIGPDNFRKDIRYSKRMLEDTLGFGVKGYRAPSFSITNGSLWALDILIEEGFVYDSSIFPISHDVYGMKDSRTEPHEIQRPGGTIWEFPLTVYRIEWPGGEIRLPVSGGGYLRFLPLWVIQKAFKTINSKRDLPFVLYFHPWELDPDQPRIKAVLKSRIRHYHNLGQTRHKLDLLLSGFRFSPMGKVLGV